MGINYRQYYKQILHKNKTIYPTYKDEVINHITQEEIDLWQQLPELEQNFLEWVNDEPYSEISVDGISLKEIFDVWNKDAPNSLLNNIRLALKHIIHHKQIPNDIDRKESNKKTILNTQKMNWIYM